MKHIKLLILLIFIFTSISCAKTDAILLKQDINKYGIIEKELNIKIKMINDEMVESITKFKKSGNMKDFEKDNIAIEMKIKELMQLTKELNTYIQTKEVKKYHYYTIQSLIIQEEYIKETIKQFKTLGEHDITNNAKLTQVKYGRKIRKIQKKQNEYLKEIIKEMR